MTDPCKFCSNAKEGTYPGTVFTNQQYTYTSSTTDAAAGGGFAGQSSMQYSGAGSQGASGASQPFSFGPMPDVCAGIGFGGQGAGSGGAGAGGAGAGGAGAGGAGAGGASSGSFSLPVGSYGMTTGSGFGATSTSGGFGMTSGGFGTTSGGFGTTSGGYGTTSGSFGMSGGGFGMSGGGSSSAALAASAPAPKAISYTTPGYSGDVGTVATRSYFAPAPSRQLECMPAQSSLTVQMMPQPQCPQPCGPAKVEVTMTKDHQAAADLCKQQLETTREELRIAINNEGFLKDKLALMQTELGKINERNNRIRKLEAEADDLRRQLKASKRETADSEAARQHAEGEAVRYALMHKASEEKTLKIPVLEQEIARLQHDLSDANTRAATAEAERQTMLVTNSFLESNLQAAKAALAKAKLECDSERSLLQMEVGELRRRLESADKAHAASVTELKVLQERMRSEAEEARKLREKLQKAEMELVSERSRFEMENGALQQRLAMAEGERDRLRQEIASTEERFQRETAERSRAEQQAARLQMEVANERSRFQMELAMLQQKLAAAEADRDGLKAQLAQMDERLKQAQTELSTTKQQLSQVQRERDDLRNQLQMLEIKIQGLTDQLSTAQSNLTELRSTFALERADLNDKINQLQARFAASQTELEGLKADLSRTEAQLQTTKTELQAANQRLVQAQAQCEEARAKLQAELLALQGKLGTTERERDEALRNAQHWESRWGEADRAQKDANSRLTQAQAQFEEARTKLQAELLALQSKLGNMERERDEALRNAQHWESRWQEADTGLKTATSRLAQAQAQCEEARAKLQAELLALQGKLGTTERERDEALRNAQHWESRWQEADKGLKDAKSRLSQAQAQCEEARAKLQADLMALQDKFSTMQRERDEALRNAQHWESRWGEADKALKAATERAGQSQAGWEEARMQMVGEMTGLQNRIAALERELEEARKRAQEWEARYRECSQEMENARKYIAQLEGRIRQLESELASVRQQLSIQLKTSTSTTETYKVKTFEQAAALSKMDGTDDGMYNNLPIEVEGEGIYLDLVRAGRKVSKTGGGGFGSVTSTSSATTYKVTSFEAADRLAKSQKSTDGTFNGVPIEVVGLGLYSDLLRSGRYTSEWHSSFTKTTTSSAGGSPTKVTSKTSEGQTYICASYEIAQQLSRMGPNDDGTYKGMPLEVKGKGLFRDLRAQGRH